MNKLILRKPIYYVSTNEQYYMNVYGYKCVLVDFDTLETIESVTDTHINASNYFNQKYGIRLIRQ